VPAEAPSLPERPKRTPDCSYRAIADEGGLVVMLKQSEVQVLNPVGVKVFSLLDGNHTIEDIVASVTAEFEVSEETAREDVRAFLGELARNGMLGD
jgi:hypothetical protein